MRTRIIVRSFEQVLQILRDNGFDVRGIPGIAGQVAVGKYGAAAVLARNPKYSAKTATKTSYTLSSGSHPPGWVLRGKISRLVDHGNQKLFETPTARIAATADALGLSTAQRRAPRGHRRARPLQQIPRRRQQQLHVRSRQRPRAGSLDHTRQAVTETLAKESVMPTQAPRAQCWLEWRHADQDLLDLLSYRDDRIPVRDLADHPPCLVTTKNTTRGGPPLEGIVIVLFQCDPRSRCLSRCRVSHLGWRRAGDGPVLDLGRWPFPSCSCRIAPRI